MSTPATHTHGPITREQDQRIRHLSNAGTGYCWLLYWIPGHPIHATPCI